MEEKVKVEKVAQVEKNSGLSWWLLLVGTAGFAVLSLLGAGVLVLLLGLG